MDLKSLLAREAIRDLVVRYATYADGGRFDDVVALFAPDASIEVDGNIYAGPVGIRSLFTGTATNATVAATPARFKHLVGSHQIDIIDGQHATGRCYVAVLMDAGLDHWGRYIDDYLAIDRDWRFLRRRISIDGATQGGWRAGLVDAIGER